MAAPNVPAAKRAGLRVDLDRLAREGDGWLTPEDRYALKTYGVCAQAQPGVFMVRVRIPGGRLTADEARGLAAVGAASGHDWLHLTTRQNVELHHVAAAEVPGVIDAVAATGLATRSACGHTLRNVMACPDAGVSLDEPFDCFPDALLVSDTIVARSATLNCVLPSRVNMAFGGCDRCREHALINDAGFVSVMQGDEAGYELWAGGSLGIAPQLAVKLADFIPRAHVLAAATALVDVFVEHGHFDEPKKGRMKFVVQAMGEEAFRAAFVSAYDAAVAAGVGEGAVAADVERSEPDLPALLAAVPDGGWGPGVRPQRTPGLVIATVRVPLGDLDTTDLVALAATAEAHGDGSLYVTRDQNIALRDVHVRSLPALRRDLAALGLGLDGADSASDVRACTGSAVCALGITDAPGVGDALTRTPGLGRASALRVHVSGCPNSCAQHQAGDIGLSGAKVRIGGKTRLGYHVWLGADIPGGVLGAVAGRVAADDVPAAVDAVIGAWEAVRRRGETLSQTVARIGVDAFAAHVTAVADGRFEAGDDDAPALVAAAVPALAGP